jgi:hypothetical protein
VSLPWFTQVLLCERYPTSLAPKPKVYAYYKSFRRIRVEEHSAPTIVSTYSTPYPIFLSLNGDGVHFFGKMSCLPSSGATPNLRFVRLKS